MLCKPYKKRHLGWQKRSMIKITPEKEIVVIAFRMHISSFFREGTFRKYRVKADGTIHYNFTILLLVNGSQLNKD